MNFSPARVNSLPQFHDCGPDWSWSPRALPDFDIWFVVAGRGWLDVEMTRHEVTAGHCLVLRPGDEPRGTQDPAAHLVVFSAHFEPPDNLARERLLQLPRCMQLGDAAAFETVARLAAQLAARPGIMCECGVHASEGTQREPEARLQMRALLGHLLWILWDENHAGSLPRPMEFVRLTEAISLKPGDDWSLARMAGQCHLSRSQFTRRFRAIFDRTPLAYVLEQRMQRARELLTETHMSVHQVATALGYRDTAFFSRQFKQVHGQSPLSYRCKARDSQSGMHAILLPDNRETHG